MKTPLSCDNCPAKDKSVFSTLKKEDLSILAENIGLNMAKFRSCLTDPKIAAEIQADFEDGQAYGITGTPGFFVNGIKVSGAQPYSVFKQIIEAELAK